MISIVTPVYNEDGNVVYFHDEVTKVMQTLDMDYEIIYVNDGSKDRTDELIHQLAAGDPHVRALTFARNFGHQIAITAGMDYATGDCVVIIDADLQDPPELIPELLAKWREGNEVVYAVRKSREGETWLKKFLARRFYRIFHRMASIDVPMDAGDFRLVDRKVIEAMRDVRELHRFMRGLTCWVGFTQCAVYYERAARHSGVTKYPVWKSANLAWDAMTSFSGAPLRWMMGFGVVVSFGGVLLAARMIVGKLFNLGETVPGWTSQMAIMLLLGGIQLVCLGLLGQYVSRVFEESKRRPLYFLREKVGEFPKSAD